MKIGTYEQIVTHLEREIELNGLEAPDELQINTVSHHATNTNADRPKQTRYHCRIPGHCRNWCCFRKKQKEQSEDTHNNPRNRNSITLSQTTIQTRILTTTTKLVTSYQCGLLKMQKEQSEDTQSKPWNKNSGANNSIPNINANKNNNINRVTPKTVTEPKTVYPFCETCGKTKPFHTDILLWSQCSQ